MFLKLRPGWNLETTNDGAVIRSDTRGFRIQLSDPDQKLLLTDLLNGTLESGHRSVDSEKILSALRARGLICEIEIETTEPENSAQQIYFDHIGIDPIVASVRIRASRVLILGLGGTGSCVLQHLVGSGVTRFVLVDADVVEIDNLERQFIYRTSDIGKQKTVAAADYILAHHAAADVRAVTRRINSDTNFGDLLLDRPDICVICIDEPPEEAFRASACAMWAAGIPCIHAGVMIHSGFYGPLFDPLRSRHSPLAFSLASSDHAPLPRLKLSFPPVNTVVAGLMSAEIVHFLAGALNLVDFNRRSMVDLTRGLLRKAIPAVDT